MDLPIELVKEFAKTTNDETIINEGATVYGRYILQNDNAFVEIDGSDGTLTPVATTSTAKNGDRVTVLIKDHTAIVTGNLTDPSASSEEVDNVKKQMGTATLDLEQLKEKLENQEITLQEYEEAIAEAKRKATDYIDFTEGNGLVIGSSTINSNVRIYSGGIDIRDGETILASYTENSISIGKNNRYSLISMCGDCFNISSGNFWEMDSRLKETLLESNEAVLTLQVPGSNDGLRYISLLGGTETGPFGGGIYTPCDFEIGGIICSDIKDQLGYEYITYMDGYTYYASISHTHSQYYEYGDNIYANKLYVQGAGNISGDPNARLAATSPYQLGYASGSSMWFKHDIKPVENEELDPHHLYDIKVYQFKYNDDYLNENDQRYGVDCIGFIAEQVNNVYPIAADRETGKPRNWEMRYIIPPMLALIQEHKKEIDTLKAKITELENKEVS